jgi:hypothetical protein
VTDTTTVHVPGQPYELTREQFVHFAGLERRYRLMLAAIEAEAAELRQTPERAEQAAFWATIGAFEAARLFQDGQVCGSDLEMDTDNHRAGMRWRYWSTSGTKFEAVEYRDAQQDLPTPRFTVTIPADRDQPGRYHYEQLRSGGTYCD